MDIGKRLQELRLSEHLTQEQAAKKLQISRAALSSYEINRRIPSLEVLLRFSKFYKVSVDYILDNEI